MADNPPTIRKQKIRLQDAYSLYFVEHVSRETTKNQFCLLAIVDNGLPYDKKTGNKKAAIIGGFRGVNCLKLRPHFDFFDCLQWFVTGQNTGQDIAAQPFCKLCLSVV